MKLNLPYQVRLTIYVVTTFGTAVIVPLYANHVVSDVVMAVWSSVAGVATGLAALNVSPDADK